MARISSSPPTPGPAPVEAPTRAAEITISLRPDTPRHPAQTRHSWALPCALATVAIGVAGTVIMAHADHSDMLTFIVLLLATIVAIFIVVCDWNIRKATLRRRTDWMPDSGQAPPRR